METMNYKQMKRQLAILFIGIAGLLSVPLSAQEVLIHSHNDYLQQQPFYHAYSYRASSIEADIFATPFNDELRVAHNLFDLPSAPTLDDAYLKPLINLFQQNESRVWKDSDQLLTLLIDIKVDMCFPLKKLIAKLEYNPEVFDSTVNPYAVRVVISGDRPNAANFYKYPSCISFDGSHTDYTQEQLERISMISLNLSDYTRWDGKGSLSAADRQKLTEVIAKVHSLGKPIRFWGTPDSEEAWAIFHTLGIDYINTNMPEACAAFFGLLPL